jgi:DNA repair exonuclease SbcCD ATPase subunit
MIINKITLNDIKCYTGKHEFSFSKINLISGENGAGKSTLALHSILFAIYGYSEVTIASLAPRQLANPNPYVEIDLNYLGKNYIIRRSIPTKISIIIDGQELTLANSQLKQKELEKLFRDVDFFRKFRMVDIKDSINILEQGNQALRKTLVSFDDSIDIGTVRANLLRKKSEREKLNKDDAVLYTHFPSAKRLQTLNNGFDKIVDSIKTIESDLHSSESYLYELSNRKGRIETTKSSLASNKNTIVATSYCPTCSQALQAPKQKELLADISTKIVDYNMQLAGIIDELDTQKEVVAHLKLTRIELLKRKDALFRRIQRLNARLSQSQYIWSTKDVEVLKYAINEVDGFTTFYMTEKLQRLEPLINIILGKLGFVVMFNIDEKSNFDITLVKNGSEFKYKDLSNGQRLLVTVAFQLALLMEKNESGLVVADEGFSSLDSKNLDLMFDLFKNSNFQLISIVHRFDTKDPAVNNILL